MDNWQKIIKLSTVDSTNNYFSGLLKNDKYPEGTLISAMHQSTGKGLGKNTWESEKGKNLLFSLILYPDFISVENQFLISKAISLGIIAYVQSKVDYVKIKWPNDIYFQDKKLAGILIENVIRNSSISQSIIGVGLNLNQNTFISDAPNPCSLSQITGKTYSLDQEVKIVRNSIRLYYDILKAGKQNEINSEYLKNLYRHNEWNNFRSNQEPFKAKITGINKFGHLQVLTENHEKKEFDLKEIEFII